MKILLTMLLGAIIGGIIGGLTANVLNRCWKYFK